MIEMLFDDFLPAFASMIAMDGSYSVEEAMEIIEEELVPVLDYVDNFYDLLRNVTILSRDMVTYVELNDDGYIVREESAAQFTFNLTEWAVAIANAFPGTLSASDIAEIPDFTITIDLEYSAVYTNIGTAVPAAPPVLTPANSVDLTDFMLMGF